MSHLYYQDSTLTTANGAQTITQINTTTTTTTVVKNAPAFLQQIVITSGSAGATLTAYDNASAGSGQVLSPTTPSSSTVTIGANGSPQITPPPGSIALQTFLAGNRVHNYGVETANGITIVTTGTIAATVFNQ